MGKLYDRSIQSWICSDNCIVFVLANVVSYSIGIVIRYYKIWQKVIDSFPKEEVSTWGFPFYWFGYSSYFFETGISDLF